MKTVLVTGATGNVGRAVMASLPEVGLAARAATSDPARARRTLGEAVDAVALDFTRPETFAPALEGVSGVFLLRPPAIADIAHTLAPFIDAALAAGVAHLVFLSVAGAEKNRLLPHRKVEDHLVARGAPYTILRPGFFAQNLGDAYRRDLREDDRLYLPAGRGRAAFIDVRDAGELAARILAEPGAHLRQAYTLTGPEALGFDRVAEILTGALGRPIRYVPASVPGYLRHLRRRGLPLGQILVQTVLHVGLRFGQADHVDPTLGRLLGRSPRTMEDYVRDHTGLWTDHDAG